MIAAQPEIMDRLRNETAEAHQRAEANPLEQALFRGTLPADGFRSYLEQRYCLHAVLDAAVRDLVESDARLCGLIPEALYQTPNLLSDLAFWNSKPSAIQPLPATNSFIDWVKSPAGKVNLSLLGAYYVFEGSKNGSRMLARVLALAYKLSDGRGLRFMDPHGADQRTLWQEFKNRMNAIEFSASEMDAMVASAKQAFDAIFAIDTEIWNRLQIGSKSACCGGACHA